mgnify:CR=1 FL=1
MIRLPLRRPAAIRGARAGGGDAPLTGRETRRLSQEAAHERARRCADSRLMTLIVVFLAAFALVGARMGGLAMTGGDAPRLAGTRSTILTDRADIVDRKGRVLATNLPTHALYAQTSRMVDPPRAARALAGIFPEMDAAALERRFTDGRSFLWLRRTVSPEQRQAVRDIGEPGLMFAPREMRLYPNGRTAAHVLGGTRFGRQGVRAAEIVGIAGIEAAMDDYLSDPANGGAPLTLTLDLTAQAALREALSGGMTVMRARGAAAVLMEAETGRIRAMTSLPDFDPNDRPAPQSDGEATDSPLFNRAVQGRYEPGSVVKPFIAATAMEEGLAGPATMIDTAGPMRVDGFTIRDFHDYGPELSLTDVIVESSNIGTGRLALKLGAARERDTLARFGMTGKLPLALAEAGESRPLLPERWSDAATVTVSYGQGMSITPVHLAAAYAGLVNGGRRVDPTLREGPAPEPGPRIVSQEVSGEIRRMLRAVVTRGTARMFGDVAGYRVGGKTGSADKPKSTGGYHDDRVISTFAAVFPADDPEYVLVVMLDEPAIEMLGETRRTAGWTAAPVAAEIIRRTAPVLGLAPVVEAPRMGAQAVPVAARSEGDG